MNLKFLILFEISFTPALNQIIYQEFLKDRELRQNVSVISDIIRDIVDVFYIKQDYFKFNIQLINDNNRDLYDVANDFLSKLKEKSSNRFFAFTLGYGKNFPLISSLIFLNSLEDFTFLHNTYSIFRYRNQPIVNLLYIHNLKYSELQEIFSFNNIRRNLFNLKKQAFSVYAYFIFEENDEIVFATVEWFSKKMCNKALVKILNVFHKDTMRWNSKLEYSEKFMQYHGCELVMMLPTVDKNGNLFHLSGYSLVNPELTDFRIFGITPKVFQIASKVFNFSDGYQPVISYKNQYVEKSNYSAIRINNTLKYPLVNFEMRSASKYSKYSRWSNMFVSLRTYVVVTPSEVYSPYEKLALPFDLLTWILLALTFVITFITIFFVNAFSKRTRHIVYGHRINNPLLNFFSIFFGISQTQLPVQNFPRFILNLFIWFCLIFRTCFQNKMFEFMTSEPRKPPPKTLSDLIDRNYTIYTALDHDILRNVKDQYGRR